LKIAADAVAAYHVFLLESGVSSDAFSCTQHTNSSDRIDERRKCPAQLHQWQRDM